MSQGPYRFSMTDEAVSVSINSFIPNIRLEQRVVAKKKVWLKKAVLPSSHTAKGILHKLRLKLNLSSTADEEIPDCKSIKLS